MGYVQRVVEWFNRKSHKDHAPTTEDSQTLLMQSCEHLLGGYSFSVVLQDCRFRRNCCLNEDNHVASLRWWSRA